jgi:hypothetical protein
VHDLQAHAVLLGQFLVVVALDDLQIEQARGEAQEEAAENENDIAADLLTVEGVVEACRVIVAHAQDSDRAGATMK